MSKIVEVILNPSTDIEKADFLYYRVSGGKLVRKLILRTPDGDIVMRGKVINQFFRYLPINYTDVIHIKDWRKRNRKVMEAIRSTNKELKFSIDYDRTMPEIVRVTSSQFVAIPHRVIIEAVEEALGNTVSDFKREVSYDYGMFATWTLNSSVAELGEAYKYRIYAFNRNDASHSLKIGSGALILVCQNGLLRWKGYSSIRLRHTSDIEKVKAKIQEVVDKLLEQEEVIGELISKAKKIPISVEATDQFLRYRFPQWIVAKIIHKVRVIDSFKEPTVWHLSQAITDVATHTEDITQRYRIELQELGGRLLEDNTLIARVRAK